MVFHNPDADHAEDRPHLRTVQWLATVYDKVPETADAQATLWERYVLGVLYYSTNGEEWHNSTNWLSTTVPSCEWEFIGTKNTSTCGTDGRLNGIALQLNGLVGSLPTVFGILPYLMSINLSSNKLQSTIPTELAAVASLQSLVLFDNTIEGSLPSSLGNLTYLRILDIANNRLTGRLPESYSALTNIGESILWY
jgi:Leucine rich repeat